MRTIDEPSTRRGSNAGRLVAMSCVAVFGIASAGLAQPCPGPDISAETCAQPVEYESARGVALGTGMRASAISTSALAYSPAALSLGQLYHIEALVDYMPGINTVALGGGIVDSATSRVGAGIGLRGFISGEDGFGGLDGRLGIAYPISEAFAIGLLGRYIDLSQENPQEDEPDLELAQGFTMGASIRFQPTDRVHVDVGALNFIDLGSPAVPFLLTGGLAIGAAEILTIGVDVLTDMSTFENPGVTLGGGVELLAGEAVPLRGGYMVDLARDVHSLTAGLGYVDRQLGFDLSLRQEVAGAGDIATRVMGSVRYHVK